MNLDKSEKSGRDHWVLRSQVFMMFKSYYMRNIPKKERLEACWFEINCIQQYGKHPGYAQMIFITPAPFLQNN